MRLAWHSYRYYPYERDLARREVARLLGASISPTDDEVILHEPVDTSRIHRLTYFASYINGRGPEETDQSKLESTARAGVKRQATRYSVHGLHEYKGKFNPQVAKALLNIFGIHAGSRVLDPFSGSGTTLVECSHLGATGVGVDLNPLAVYIANAKLAALSTPAFELQRSLEAIEKNLKRRRKTYIRDDARSEYLRRWFMPDVFYELELLGDIVRERSGSFADYFLVGLSNLVRDYSLQDPVDLRIRRRKTPLPDTPLTAAFLDATKKSILRLQATQSVIGVINTRSKAINHDIRYLRSVGSRQKFDAALTSPPYATALPYIDTQRLSLVWLNLIGPEQILTLDSELVGSRELRNATRRAANTWLSENPSKLPDEQLQFCNRLQKAIGKTDGFRRRAVPILLYRYFSGMLQSFVAVKRLMKTSAPFGLIVGHNHTVLGGERFDIDTPHHLSKLAAHSGWDIEELVPLQTYQRFGYHVGNAVADETLVLLKNGN